MAAINRAGIGEPVELPQTVQLGKWICGLRLASFVMEFALFLFKVYNVQILKVYVFVLSLLHRVDHTATNFLR